MGKGKDSFSNFYGYTSTGNIRHLICWRWNLSSWQLSREWLVCRTPDDVSSLLGPSVVSPEPPSFACDEHKAITKCQFHVRAKLSSKPASNLFFWLLQLGFLLLHLGLEDCSHFGLHLGQFLFVCYAFFFHLLHGAMVKGNLERNTDTWTSDGSTYLTSLKTEGSCWMPMAVSFSVR